MTRRSFVKSVMATAAAFAIAIPALAKDSPKECKDCKGKDCKGKDCKDKDCKDCKDCKAKCGCKECKEKGIDCKECKNCKDKAKAKAK